MTTAATSLLGLALPVTGELNGTWGDTVNNSITSLLDSAVAGTTTISTDGDVTLTTTTLAANQAREAILLFSGARTAQRTVTAPAQSKLYTVINATTGGFAVKLVGAGPTTGLTIPAGASALVAWNGSDFVEIGATTINSLTVSGNLSVGGTTLLTGVATLTANPVFNGGTANGVAYLNGSKVVTTGSALVFDGTNLGIGTSSPDAKLTVNGQLSVGSQTSGQRTYMGTNGTNNFIQSLSSTATAVGLAFYNGGTQNMLLDSAGNLGLGVTPSAWGSSGTVLKAFQLGTGSGGGNFIAGSNGFSGTFIGANSYFNGTNWIYASTAPSAYYNVTAGSHAWYNAPSGTAGNAITFTQAMTLDASGNLLVGRTAVSDFTVGFQTTSAGRVACGMASGDAYILYSTSASAYRFYVTNAGQINATSIVINAISDQRLKENVRDIDTGLDAIMSLKPRRFDWKEGKGQDKKDVAGFIAQEFETVFPECVSTTKAGEDGIEYKNINHETLIPTLVKAVQELKAEFDAYKATHP